MATYCFKCRSCGATFTLSDRSVNTCYECGEPLARDYRAEAVGFNTATLKRERRFSLEADKSMFLPSGDDFASPSDPTGQKGLREWRESVRPKEENKRPVDIPDLDKKVF